jgi:DNA-binding response OmpR family regulator
MRLLLVEDEIDIQSFLRTSLEEAGYEVEAAADGKTAERIAVDGEFDILIVDLGLPDQDGISSDPQAASVGSQRAGADSLGAAQRR